MLCPNGSKVKKKKKQPSVNLNVIMSYISMPNK